tara:strand:+ start:455 stop:577 length:123 start_codon:yes stop_codon:yes gene_type:complete
MLKKLKEDQEMPKDFWNYKVNPILGYEYEPLKLRSQEIKR